MNYNKDDGKIRIVILEIKKFREYKIYNILINNFQINNLFIYVKKILYKIFIISMMKQSAILEFRDFIIIQKKTGFWRFYSFNIYY